MRKIVLLLASAFLLTACADTPENILESQSSSAAAVDEPTDSQPEASPQTKTYENLTFADTFTVNAPDLTEVGVYEAQRRSDLAAHKEEIFKAWAGESYDASCISEETIPGTDGQTAYHYTQNGYVVHLFNSSFIGIENLEDKALGMIYGSDDELLEQYEVTDAFKDKTVSLAKGKASVGELCQVTEKFLKELKGLGLEFEPFTVSTLRGNGREHPAAVMTLRSCFKGLPVFNMCFAPDDDNDDDLSFVLQYSEAFTFASPDRISFASLPAPYAETKEIKKLDKLLTPDEAIDAAADQLAKYMKLTALRLDLVYVPVSQSGDEAGESVIMTPYWQLDFGLKPMAEHYALINAETGKVSYVEPN